MSEGICAAHVSFTDDIRPMFIFRLNGDFKPTGLTIPGQMSGSKILKAG